MEVGSSMSTNLQRVGTSLLDMDGIATQLHIKGVLQDIDPETGEEIYSPFVSANDIKEAGTDGALLQTFGRDKDGVSVPISCLAIAYRPEGISMNEVDRETIKNAYMLNNHTDDYFYTAEQGEAAEKKVSQIVDKFSNELYDIRAQNVQLLNMLAKKGIIEQYRPWGGFYDTFRINYPVHQHSVLGTAFVDSQTQNMMRIRDEEIQYFNQDDYVIIVNGDDLFDSSNRKLLRIDKITGTTIMFSGYTGFPIKAEQAHIYRSLGCSYKNTFAFGRFEEQHASAKEIYTCLDDDNFRTRRKINAAHTGYATTFRINPSRANGAADYYLASIDISAKKIGSPGALKCYVINAAYIDQFEDPSQAKDAGLILAESQPLTMENKSGETIVSFDFSDSGQYPLLQNIDQGIDLDIGRTRFCMIIEALDADNSNYYELLFLQHYDADTNTLSDLQLNNILYEYTESGSATYQSQDNFNSLITNSTINNADLFYGVTFKPVEHSKFVPYNEGVYSARFQTYEPINVGHARLTMRVAREGIFTIVSTSANQTNDVPDNGTIRYVEDSTYRANDDRTITLDGFSVLADQGEDHNRLIVIGEHVRELSHADGDKLVLKKGAHIEPGDIVYPLGYVAYLQCSNMQWNKQNQAYERVGDSVKIKLDTISVQPFYTKEERDLINTKADDKTADDIVRERLRDQLRVSDNILFEADLNGKEYNHFELQVYWRSMANKTSESFAGRIYDLSVSLDRVII